MAVARPLGHITHHLAYPDLIEDVEKVLSQMISVPYHVRQTVAEGVERADQRERLWGWLERHAAILPQELDQLKSWYADAHAERKLPLVPLHNLLEKVARRIHT